MTGAIIRRGNLDRDREKTAIYKSRREASEGNLC